MYSRNQHNRKENTVDELEDHERRIAFEKKYVLRSDYERDLRAVRRQTVENMIILFVFIVPTVGAILFAVARGFDWL